MKPVAVFVLLIEFLLHHCSAEEAPEEPFSIKKVNGVLDKLRNNPPDELNGVGDMFTPAVAELDLEPAKQSDNGCDCVKQQMQEQQADTHENALVQYNGGKPVDAYALVKQHGLQGKDWSFLMKRSQTRRQPGAPPAYIIKETACDCEPDPPKGPDTDIDGEVIWLNQCTLTQKDLEFWKLVRTEYRSGGIILPNTIAYSASCTDCQQHNLQCAANEVKLERGYCLCMWRVDGADKKLKLLPCGRCVADCVGKYYNFDLGVYLQPVQQRGICIKKKAYFNLD